MLALLQQATLQQQGQLDGGGVVQRSQQGLPEHRAHHGGLLQGQSLRGGQHVQLGLQHAVQRGWQAGRVDRALQTPAWAGVARRSVCLCRQGLDAPLGDQRLQQLFHEEGIAAGPVNQQLVQRRHGNRVVVGHGTQGCQQAVGQGLAGLQTQRLQVDAVVLGRGPAGLALVQPGAGQGQHQHRLRRAGVAVRQALDETEAGGVRPVQVVQQQNQGQALLAAQPDQQFGQSAEGTLANLSTLLGNAPQVRTVREVQAQQVAKHMGIGFSGRTVGVVCQIGRDRGSEPVPRDGRAVAVGQVQCLADEVVQQGERQSLGLGPGAYPQPQGLGRITVQAVLPVLQQPRLAQARLGHHADQPRAGARCPQCLPSGVQLCQGTVAAHQWRVQASHATAQCGCTLGVATGHQPGGQGRIVTFDLQRRLVHQIEQALHQPCGVVADAQGARGCALLHARRQVDRGAADGVARVHPAAQQHRASVQAHAHIEDRLTMLAMHAIGQQSGFGQQRQAGGHCVFSIVFS